MNFWATSPPPPTTLIGRFRAVIDGIGVKIGLHLGANRHLEPILSLVYAYLQRSTARLDRLIASWHAGTLAPPPPPRARPTPDQRAPDHRAPCPRLPSRNGWLLHLVQPAAQHAGHLHTLVASPEMAELLAAAPQAIRILRPLLKMLGIQPFPPILRRPNDPPPQDGPILPRRRPPTRYTPAPLPDLAPPILLSPLGLRFSLP